MFSRHAVQRSLATFRPFGPALMAQALAEVRERAPHTRALFPADASHLHARLFNTLEQVVEHLDRFDKLEGPLAHLGAMAARRGALPADYAMGRDALLQVMRGAAGEGEWSSTLETQWAMVLDAVAGAMMLGAEAAPVESFASKRRAA